MAQALRGPLFESFLDTLPWPAAVVAESRHVTYLNAAMRARGLPAAPSQDQRFDSLFPEYSAALPGNPPWAAPLELEVSRAAPGGTVRERLHVTRHGQCSVLIVRDETRRYELEEGYAQNARLASLGFLLASVSHEANGPLSAISSTVQILESRRGVSDAVWQKGIRLISESTRRLLLITRKLTGFVRVAQQARSPFAIDNAIDDACVQLRYDPCGKEMNVEHQREPRAIVTGNQDQAQQVFFNLFLNAAQACEGSGKITVSTSCSSDEVIVRVRDSGPGIPEPHHSRVFEPFYTTKDGGSSIGLGLAISSEIVHEHKGSIAVRSDPTGGSLFELSFPLTRADGSLLQR